MSTVVLDVSMSLDGFTTGPNVRPAAPLGDGGERLHEWMFRPGPDSGVDAGIRQAVDAAVGATVTGRRTFDLGLGPWGGTPWPGVPSFVLQTQGQNTVMISDVPGPTGGILLKTTTGAMIAINDVGITISNGKGATIVLTGPSVTINNGALTII